MNRREFLQSSSVAALTAGVGGMSHLCCAAAAVPAMVPSALICPPTLINPSPTGVTVACAVNAMATGWVEYGDTPSLGLRADGEVHGLRPHSNRVLAFPIGGLKPGTRYFYRVHACAVGEAGGKRGEEVRSETLSFRTLDPKAAKASFTVWNDTHEQKPTLSALAAMLKTQPTDFLLWNGDVTNDIHAEAKIPGQFISPAGLAFADTTPLMLGRGNHDTRGRDARRLADYICGPGGRFYYAFRQGPVAFLVLDTGEDKPDNHPAYRGLGSFAAYRTAQQQWLKEAMTSPLFTSAAFRIAFMHIPLVWEAAVPESWPGVWGSGIKGWICEEGYAKWHDLLVAGKVDVVISGHTHRPAWFPPNANRPYGQLIGGGPKPEEATCITGMADSGRLEVLVKKLSGEVVISQQFVAR